MGKVKTAGAKRETKAGTALKARGRRSTRRRSPSAGRLRAAERKLLRAVPGPRTQEFLEFHRKNREVWEQFRRFAYKALQRRKHYSARDIVCRIRWFTDIETIGDSYKINNNWSPFYGRLLVFYDESFEGFFEMRQRRF